MAENSFCYFKNEKCAFYPCHKVPEGSDYFNCLFCYCPLYALGKNCGGNFKYLDGGIKDCSDCMLPHSPSGYAYVTGNYPKLVERMNAMEEQEQK